jgi:hypothetical protein
MRKPPLVQSRLVDLGYRFLLWSSLSFSLHYLATLADDNGGKRLAAALRNPPNDEYATVVFGFALLLFVVALLMKDLNHLISAITVLGRLGSITVALIARVSSDLLMSTFGMGAFIVGWMGFDGYYRHVGSVWTGNTVRVLGFGLAEFLGLVVALGLMAVVVRIDQENRFARAWYQARFIWRLLAYLTFLLGLYYAFWINPDASPLVS